VRRDQDGVPCLSLLQHCPCLVTPDIDRDDEIGPPAKR
jgi:hypothetical protein